MSDIPEFETLEEAKQYLRENWEKGVNCPCCTQRVQLYRPKLYATQAVALIQLYREHRTGEEWIHADRFDHYTSAKGRKGRGHNFAEMRHWGLIEEMPKDPDNKKLRTSGLWKITELGKQFVKGEVTVRERIRLFKSTSYGFEGKQISIMNVLDVKFNYDELMGSVS